MPEPILLHIDGKDVAAAGGVFDARNPGTANSFTPSPTARPTMSTALCGPDGPPSTTGRWRHIPARARARILNRAATLLADQIDDYARMETQQIGRPLREMRAQLARLPEWLEYFGALAQTLEGTSPDFGADHLNVVRRVPLGVVGLITPWNHPC